MNLLNNYIALTYYQIMASLAFVIDSKEDARLFISVDYLNISPEMIENIKKTGVFKDVIGFSEKDVLNATFSELKKLPDKDPSVLENNLYPFYKEIFKDCKRDETTYVFNELQGYWYFVEPFFDNIIKVEDGYKSFGQELQIHVFKGRYKLFEDYFDNGYPLIHANSPKIKQIIISSEDERIPLKYHDRILIKDINSLFYTNFDLFSHAMITIFGQDTSQIDDNSILVITQPLARAMYCTKLEQYLLYKSVVKKYEKTHKVFIKPHPADLINYEPLLSDKVILMDKAFSIDVFNFLNIQFLLGITFGSTSLGLANYLKNKEELFTQKDFTRHDVTKHIHHLIYSRDNEVNDLVKITIFIDVQTQEQLDKLIGKKYPFEQNHTIVYLTDKDLILKNTIRRHIFKYKTNMNESEKYIQAIAKYPAMYYLFASTEGKYTCSSKNIFESFKNYFDIYQFGLKQVTSNKTILRIFNKIPRDNTPFILENKFFSHKLLLKYNNLGLSSNTKELFYLDLISLSNEYSSMIDIFLEYKTSKNSLNGYSLNSIAENIELLKFLKNRVLSIPSEYMDGYYKTIASVIYWKMYYDAIHTKDMEKYNEIIRLDEITSVSPQILLIILRKKGYNIYKTGNQSSLLIIFAKNVYRKSRTFASKTRKIIRNKKKLNKN